MARRRLALPAALMTSAAALMNPTTSVAQVASGAETLAPVHIPTVMVSVGYGSATDPYGSDRLKTNPMPVVAVEFMARRHLVIEAEAARWDAAWDLRFPGVETRAPTGVGFSGERFEAGSLKAWSAGVNLLYRTEPRRASAFVGGGPFFGVERYTQTIRFEGCVPPPGFAFTCTRPFDHSYESKKWRLQAVTGADVQIAGPLRAYGSLQFTTMRHAWVRVSGGARVVALARSAAPATPRSLTVVAGARPSAARQGDLRGTEVRVTLANGERANGRFLSMSDSELFVQRGSGDTRYQLDQVLKVETVHRTARKAAIIGGIAGFVSGYLLSCGGGDEEHCWPEIGALFGGIGAGGAALYGAFHDHRQAAQHVVYSASSSTVRVAPLASPRGAGFGVALRF